MTVVGRTLFLTSEYLRGSKALAVFREIEHNPKLSRRSADSLQLVMLRRLLTHAQANVPYYRELFRDHGIVADDIRSLKDFEKVPVLTKKIVRERNAELVAENIDRSKLQPHHSGGSTGQPLSFYHDPNSIYASDAGTWRAFSQVGWRPGDSIAFFWGWNRKMSNLPKWERFLRQAIRRSWQFDSFNADESQMEQWLRTIQRVRPMAAHGYASAIARFAEWVLASDKKLPPVRGVFTTAEKLYAPQRESIEAAFGCKVFDCYGSSEVRNIATECLDGSMHVNSDYVVLETLEHPGEIGPSRPFVITSLRSYGMPFIRYVNEDCGSLLSGDCTCGGGFPLMSLDIARTTDHFVFSNGRIVHGLFLIHQLYGSEGIETFQFHQIKRDLIILYVVPAKGGEAARHSSLNKVLTTLQGIDRDLVVEVREVEGIPLSSSGKHRYVRSDEAISLSV